MTASDRARSAGAHPIPPAPPTLALLGVARAPADYDVTRIVIRDSTRRGAVAVLVRQGVARRAEPGPAGPLVLEARREGRDLVCEVWGPPATPPKAVEQAVEATIAWAGLRDRPGELRELVAGHPRAWHLLRGVGEVRLSRLPRAGEALGRSVLSQLVQGVEAARSIRRVAAATGSPASGGLWAWPTPAQIGTSPAWSLRRCGVSLRGARALHEGARADCRLTEAIGDWPLLDRRLRSLPGVGAWTAAETRLALGDPDAVSVGDYHLPTIVGWALAQRPGDAPGGKWTDAEMLTLLAPFAGQRGRVIRLCEHALRRGLARGPGRRGPRSPLSLHRYW